MSIGQEHKKLHAVFDWNISHFPIHYRFTKLCLCKSYKVDSITSSLFLFISSFLMKHIMQCFFFSPFKIESKIDVDRPYKFQMSKGFGTILSRSLEFHRRVINCLSWHYFLLTFWQCILKGGETIALKVHVMVHICAIIFITIRAYLFLWRCHDRQ